MSKYMKKKYPFALNIQFFAEGAEGTEGNDGTEPEGPAPIQMTQAELDALLQRESDKRVTAALKKQKSTLEEETRAKIEEEKAEAARLAKLSEADRAKAEFNKRQKEFELKTAEFEKQQKEFEKKALQLEATKILSEKGLPVEFMEFLVQGETSQDVLDHINQFGEKFNAAVDKAVAEKLKSHAPGRGVSASEPTTLNDALKDFYKLK